MNKKVTIKDIAREAGVSVATVSYIINNRKDQKISKDTIEKVEHLVNLYNYRPNLNARNLSTSHNKMIAVNFPSGSILQTLEAKIFLDKLSNLLADKEYSLIYLPESLIENHTEIDALVIYNTTKTQFYHLSNKNFCPVIAVDCYISDPLFYQVNLDFFALKQAANEFFNGQPFAFACLAFSNTELTDDIQQIFDHVYFYQQIKDIHQIRDIPYENIVTINPTLSSLLSGYGKQVFHKDLHQDTKFDLIFNCIHNAISRIEDSQHKIVF